jgi:hypothetical protein
MTWCAWFSIEGTGNTGWVFVDRPSVSISANTKVRLVTANTKVRLITVKGK